jgi:aminoglycoside phosphotransferase (APT) family kinase protein
LFRDTGADLPDSFRVVVARKAFQRIFPDIPDISLFRLRRFPWLLCIAWRIRTGGFFGALHTAAPADAPANPSRGVPLAARAGTFAKNLSTILGQVDRDAVLAVWEAALDVPVWPGAPVWVHGDPHPANILVCDGRVSGVLDFGDITAGDPACDLSLAWMLLPASCHGQFRAAYAAAGNGTISDATWARGRGWAVNLAIVLLAWSADNPRLHAVGRRTLGAVLAGLELINRSLCRYRRHGGGVHS